MQERGHSESRGCTPASKLALREAVQFGIQLTEQGFFGAAVTPFGGCYECG